MHMHKETKGPPKNKQEQFSNKRRKQFSLHQYGIFPKVIFLFPKLIYKNNNAPALNIKLLSPVQTLSSAIHSDQYLLTTM